MAYTHDGSGQFNLWRQSVTGGWPDDVTGREGVQFQPGHQHPDGEQLSFSGNSHLPTDIGVHVLHVPTCGVRPLLEERTESDQMVDRLRRLGGVVEYHVFEDEGHGFTKRANQLRASRLIADFLLRHLGVEA